MSLLDVTSSEAGSLRRENERLQRAVHELTLLNDLASAIGAYRNSNDVMKTIINRSVKAVDAQQGTITIVKKNSDQPETLVRSTAVSSSKGKFHLSDAIVGWMGLHRKPLVIHDVKSDERFSRTQFESNIASVLAVPLIVKSDVRAVLTVYNKRHGLSFNDDDLRLLSIIAAQSAQIIENTRLTEEEKSLVRMREQLRLAGDVQKHLLPESYPVIDGYELTGTSVAAQEIGGDYFDFIALPEGSCALCLGDVSGKGIPASLLMANVQAMVRMLTSMRCPADECMQRANELLCHCTACEKFVTFFYSVLDPKSHSLTFCNAGHNPPLVVTDGEPVYLQNDGIVLGIVEKFKYSRSTVHLAPGDVVVIYSDGVTEAVDRSDEEFGVERLLDVVQRVRHEPASAIQEHILNAVHLHADGKPQHDDLTLVVAKRLPDD